jgi:SAM-dependent methyltransferase
MTIWHEDDEFWETWASYLFSKRIWEQTPVDVEQLISLLALEPDIPILDLCCGTGRFSLEFARRGFQVTGVDRTKIYLDEAKKRAKNEKLNIEFIQDDMRKFCRSDSFGLVLNFYTSFSYFKDPEEDKQVLRNVYSSLKNGGKFVIEMMGKEVLARIFLERDWQEQNGVYMLEERKVSENWSWMENRWIMISKKEIREFKVEHRLYSAIELNNLLTDVGFRKITFYGDLDGATYDNNAKRLIGIAEK